MPPEPSPGRLRRWLLARSTRLEALVVLGGAFGYPLVSTAYLLLAADPGPRISEPELEKLLLFEGLLLAALGAFLYLRGWTPRRLGLVPNLPDTVVGLGLGLAAYVAMFVLWVLCSAAGLPVAYLGGSASLVNGDLFIGTVIGVSGLNALFEELFVCGYLVTVAREQDRVALGVNASVALRLAYHLYQGGVGVVGIIPFGLVLAGWYGKTGRLWPVVVAHAATDLAALLPYAR